MADPYGPPGGPPRGYPPQPGYGQPPPGTGQPQPPQGQPSGYGPAPTHPQTSGPGYGQQPQYRPPGHGQQPPYGHAQQQQVYRPPQAGYGSAQAQTYWQQQGFGRGAAAMPDPDRTRRLWGLAVWIVAMLVGILLNIVFQVVEIAGSRSPGQMFGAILQGAVFAFIPLCVYLSVPAVLDRYDPEPWWCLAMAFLWGAVVATGFSGFINTFVHVAVSAVAGKGAGEFVSAVISAPLCEEFFKGLAVFGIFVFLRREFDGVVDGIIYATFAALGFAAVENISYYARAEMHGVVLTTFFLRGVLAPWGHPLYTSMTGIGFGISRESTSTAVRWLAPVGGYFVGVTLHAIWNFAPTVLGNAFWYLIPLWLIFVMAFFGIVVALVIRKGRTIRQYLKDEVLLGNLSQEEVNLITSPVGRLTCTFSWRGATGRAFIGAGARLALSKWHTARAMKGHKRTISADFIVPLRQELQRLRGELMAKMPR